MDDQKMQIIGQLMEELQDLMGQSEGDFGERLGREPKGVEVVKMGVMGGDEEMPDEEEEYCPPEEKLKSRLLKLRG